MIADIIEELDNLIKQAETEKSHFYVSKICKKAIAEILMLRSRPTYDAYHAVCRAYWKRVEEGKEKDVGQKGESARVREFIQTCGNFYLAHGAKEWERGRVPNKPSEEDFHDNTPVALVWLGYMVARALDLQERWKVAEMLECSASSVQPRD